MVVLTTNFSSQYCYYDYTSTYHLFLTRKLVTVSCPGVLLPWVVLIHIEYSNLDRVPLTATREILSLGRSLKSLSYMGLRMVFLDSLN